ncbi:argininosuccinate lyase [bacterium]|nr:argininosuccinate lyase [bacterium]
MKYMWEGRFEKKVRDDVIDFTSSLELDKHLAFYDIKGSIAHCKMLNKANILTSEESKTIIEGLNLVEKELREGKFVFQQSDEDIHTAIERRLVELVGKAGEKLHTARSRNDQIVLDEKLFTKDIILAIISEIEVLQKSLLSKAEEMFPAIMSAYTHLQQSQPVLLSHYLLAYIEMLERDKNRLKDSLKRVDILPSGACACCGTSLNIDRNYMAELLGFSNVSKNSLDTVSDRDFLAEPISDCAILMVHLSRFAEDMIIWNTSEFAFIELPDEYCTGSSIMPQKKNPDVLELIRGKASSCIASITGILSLQKGLPLSYNRDLQEDKKFFIQSLTETLYSVKLLSGVVLGTIFKKDRLISSITEFTLTTDIAEYLVKKNVPFREAHRICGKIVRYCISEKKTFDSLTKNEWEEFSPNFSDDIINILNYDTSVNSKNSYGGTSPKLVQKEIEIWKKKILK